MKSFKRRIQYNLIFHKEDTCTTTVTLLPQKQFWIVLFLSARCEQIKSASALPNSQNRPWIQQPCQSSLLCFHVGVFLSRTEYYCPRCCHQSILISNIYIYSSVIGNFFVPKISYLRKFYNGGYIFLSLKGTLSFSRLEGRPNQTCVICSSAPHMNKLIDVIFLSYGKTKNKQTNKTI